MNVRRGLLLFATLATAAAGPGPAQATASAGPAEPADGTHGTAPIPDFTRVWNRPAFPWFEPPASGRAR